MCSKTITPIRRVLSQRRSASILAVAVLALCASAPRALGQFSSGSNGSDGDYKPTTSPPYAFTLTTCCTLFAGGRMFIIVATWSRVT